MVVVVVVVLMDKAPILILVPVAHPELGDDVV